MSLAAALFTAAAIFCLLLQLGILHHRRLRYFNRGLRTPAWLWGAFTLVSIAGLAVGTVGFVLFVLIEWTTVFD